MKNTKFQINGIPVVLWGVSSKKVYLYIHGQGGYKEEAEVFADIACSFGLQVNSKEIPKHM